MLEVLSFCARESRGRSRIFLRGGGALVSCSTSTPINHIVFFGRIPVVLENCRSSRRGGGAHPLHPPPRSARGEGLTSFNNDNSANLRMVKKSTIKPTAMSIFLRIRKKTLSQISFSTGLWLHIAPCDNRVLSPYRSPLAILPSAIITQYYTLNRLPFFL